MNICFNFISSLKYLLSCRDWKKNVDHLRLFMPQGLCTCQNLDRDARPIFLGLKFGQILFFWVGKFFLYFSGFRKISAIFMGLTNFQLFFGSSNFVSHA